ncbi:hypothetical protein MKW98_012891 [Papaver atlanticum]|uniref:PCI domain-containing protein n=1 Tax=Papaver atlanticum TaxID=357466 RepID=A0AAD4SI12_9MAGN|nr:hypothetical protein MKW98_012891 [Papaver atlanticum]
MDEKINCRDFLDLECRLHLVVLFLFSAPHVLECCRHHQRPPNRQQQQNQQAATLSLHPIWFILRYTNDPEILAMTNLIAAFQRNEILEFEKILKSNRRTIMDDPFIRNYIEDLLKNIRTQVFLKLIKPYTTIRIPYISKELNVPEKDVEQLLVSLTMSRVTLIK